MKAKPIIGNVILAYILGTLSAISFELLWDNGVGLLWLGLYTVGTCGLVLQITLLVFKYKESRSGGNYYY